MIRPITPLCTPSIDELVEDARVVSSGLSGQTGIPGPHFKPCVMLMLKKQFCRGEIPNRHEVAVVISSELVRLSLPQDQVIRVLENWDEENLTCIGYREVERTVETATRQQYNYSCRHRILKTFCIGPENCPYTSLKSQRKPRGSFRDFIRYGWPKHLKPVQINLYWMAINEIEIRRGVGIGGRIFASHRELANICGCNARWVGKHLHELAALTLIQYNPGVPRKWEGKASEITRVRPVPVPTTELIQRIKQESRSPAKG